MGALPRLQPCPCGRLGPARKPLALGDCCGRFLADRSATPAPDAESLMRSRYTAFVLQRADYLLATWHATTRPSRIGFDAGVKWLGLEVRQHRAVDADHAEVEFVARQKSPGVPAVRLHERSRFVREADAAGCWYYVDGDHL
ncbi:YchJ family metal-binding protein [Polaromonas sp.]|uniref:YchJ family protein n=1 Tax=Polaromonas sp. TaxID=1869339 RepID=UPI002B9DD7E9|nr:YchJ family metal-binding protein [Polaromonas sp.]HQS32067.1 YchJ family metal-binding protein [Polaromonas sp.]HQS91317.1 YchJ family metal-binding protein [Polaromonas sp.]